MRPLRLHGVCALFLVALAGLTLPTGGLGPIALAARAPGTGSESIPTPEASFGFKPGTEGRLASWTEISKYFDTVARASDRVELTEVGVTTEGNRLIAAIVSAPENIARLAAIREANQRLADPRTLSPEEAARLAADQKVIVAIGCSIHADEIGATQAANELLYHLATATDPSTLEMLRNVVLVLMPSLNPDGHTLVVNWFEKNRGTPFEAAPMPWLYHRYVGHDINRDAFMMNLAENRNLARFFYTEWHPQVFLTMHQMGSKGPRFFVPPNYEPIDPNYDPLIWREAGLLGHAMALELEHAGKSGVVSNALFDYYWPGYEDSAPLGHNTVCLLTEVASARLALPVVVAPSELSGSPHGLPQYRPQINFPNPWPGGTWTLADIVDYDLTAVKGLLGAASRYRESLLQNFYLMGKRAVEKGSATGPFAFLIPPDQYDPHAAAKLTNLLIQGGVEIQRAEEPFRAGGVEYPIGTAIVVMAQPYRAYVKTLLERQDYPARRLAPQGPPERPYDVAGWTLPYQMGVTVTVVDRPFRLPMTSRLERATIPPAEVGGERRASYLIVEGRGNGGAMAVMRLRAAGLQASWTSTDTNVSRRRFARGSIVVGDSRRARQSVQRVARELGLAASGARGKLPSGLLRLQPVRLALYKPWVRSIDEGWTRWLFEQYEFPFTSISDQDVRRTDLGARFDAIMLPDAPAERLIAGHAAGAVPPEYAGGLGEEGITGLKRFVEAGGTLIALDSSGDLAINAFKLPVRDLVRDARPDEFFCPGSILRLDLDPAQPLAYGMPEHTAAFFAYSAAYEITAPRETTEETAVATTRSRGSATGHSGPGELTAPIQIVGRYGSKDLLLSGWLEGGDRVAGQAAVVEARAGLGRVVLIGFRAQHRAQSHATFRLLFNAILTTGIKR
ncbi:MAG: hypothetical protein HYX76_02850 [Acidobacteria bacterium]|nr:hypothetical protein [Acidobacteriota bacterium]